MLDGDHGAALAGALRSVESGEYGTALPILRHLAAGARSAELRDRARIAGMQVAARMYDLATMVELRDLGPAGSAEHGRSLRLLSLVADSMDGSVVAARSLLDEVNARLDGPLPEDEVRFIAESLALAIARSGLGTEFFDVLLRVSGMANDVGAPGLVCSLLIAEAAYRSRSNLESARVAAGRAVDLAVADGDLRSLPFALAQLATAQASLGEPEYSLHADRLAAFGAGPAVLVADFARAMYALTVGDDEMALRYFAGVHDRHCDDTTAPVSWHAELVELLADGGQFDRASAVVASLERLVGLCSIPWLDAALCRAQGVIASDATAAAASFSAGVVRYEERGYSIAAARTLYSHARWLQRAGTPPDEMLVAARVRFESAGMTRWAAR
ncbi:MAG: hypothetical protein ACO3S5_09970, partial [Ilumatobacteraceae bacterium]